MNNTMKERLLFLICFLCISFMLKAADKPVIKISTENVDLIYRVGNNGRLYQSYLGKRLNHATDIAHLPQGSEAYLTHGMEDYFEPAIHIVHNDGNPSTLLKYVSHTRNQVSPGVDEVVITMQDDKYPVTVKLHYVAYQKENLIKTFTEISHREKKPVQLHKYALSGCSSSSDSACKNDVSVRSLEEQVQNKNVPRNRIEHILTTSFVFLFVCMWHKDNIYLLE